MATYVRFERPGRGGHVSQEYGPFWCIILTRNALLGFHTHSSESLLLAWQCDDDRWESPLENQVYTDVVIHQKGEEDAEMPELRE